MPHSDRHFSNKFPDYQPEGNDYFENGQLTDAFRKRLRETIVNLYDVLVREAESSVDVHDASVYTGSAGIALLHWKMALTFNKDFGHDAVHECRKFLKSALEHVKGGKKHASFLAGDAGPYALGCYLYSQESINHPDRVKECWEHLQHLAQNVVNLEHSSEPNEVLYGRAGYLYTLLYLKNKTGDQLFDTKHLIEKTVNAIATAGREESENTHGWKPSKPPLVYKWHDSYYVGAAHGFAGILYMLMKAGHTSGTEFETQFMKPTIDFIVDELSYDSGNFRSSVESEHDKLVQWCHGAPGVIFMLCEAFRCFQDRKYYEAALRCGEVVWQRGILSKSFGLCHGTAGNAYTFIELYRLTRDEKYLYRAVCFADWCCDFGKVKVHTPDRPYSLFEGMAGVLYFLLDIYNDPAKARFPAFDPESD